MCLAPMYGRWIPEDGKYKILPMRWLGEPVYDKRDIMIPCGGCVECRLAKSREWADRMMLELDHSKTAIFATLTYSPEHIPLSMFDDNDEPIYTLDKRDVQLFMKRLRKRFEPREIRFAALRREIERRRHGLPRLRLVLKPPPFRKPPRERLVSMFADRSGLQMVSVRAVGVPRGDAPAVQREETLRIQGTELVEKRKALVQLVAACALVREERPLEVSADTVAHIPRPQHLLPEDVRRVLLRPRILLREGAVGIGVEAERTPRAVVIL